MKLATRLPYKIKRFLFKLWQSFTHEGRVSDGGSRIVVSSWGNIINTGEFQHILHAHRYYWAGQQIPIGSTILDFGCGSGYGSWYLASLGNTVIGYDPDESVIEWCIQNYNHKNLSFTSTLPPISFNHIVCFEVLEHAPIIDTIISKLNENGTLILSTPNATPNNLRDWLLKTRKATPNQDHTQEYSYEDLVSLLSDHFNQVTMLSQCVKGIHDYNAYNQVRGHSPITVDDLEMRSGNDNCSEVLIAICQ